MKANRKTLISYCIESVLTLRLLLSHLRWVRHGPAKGVLPVSVWCSLNDPGRAPYWSSRFVADLLTSLEPIVGVKTVRGNGERPEGESMGITRWTSCRGFFGEIVLSAEASIVDGDRACSRWGVARLLAGSLYRKMRSTAIFVSMSCGHLGSINALQIRGWDSGERLNGRLLVGRHHGNAKRNLSETLHRAGYTRLACRSRTGKDAMG